MSQSEPSICQGSPTPKGSTSSDDTACPDRTTSDTEVLPREVQLIYLGVDKEPETFPPSMSPSEQLSSGLPTQIKTRTSARASLPTEIWDMIFSDVERWQERKDLTQAWTSIRRVCRGFKTAVERIFKEKHIPKLILHFEGGFWNYTYDTFVNSKVQRLMDAEAARYPEKFHGGNPRNNDDPDCHGVSIDGGKFVFKRNDDSAPRRVVLESSCTDDRWTSLIFRRLLELATGQDDFCLGALGDPPTSDPGAWDSTVLGQAQAKSDLTSLYSENVVAADPAAYLKVTTQVRDIMNDCTLPDLWINSAEEEISLDWHALCCRVYGEEKALTDMLNMTPTLAQNAYVAWMERVDHQCLSRFGPSGWPRNMQWRYQNSQQRKKIWLDEFLDRQKEYLTTWRESMRRQCHGRDKFALERDRLTSEHLLQKYSADLEIRFDKESGANVMLRSPPLPPKVFPWDDHTPVGKDPMSEARWDTEYRTHAAIMERTRFLERRTKRKRHEVTEQGNGHFRFSHYDSAEMPPTKRLKTHQGMAICQDFPEPYPLESLVGIDADWAANAWHQVERHEIPYQRILNTLPQQTTRHPYITDGVELLYKSWKPHYSKMLIAPPVYVHSVERVEELLEARINPKRPWRIDPSKRRKRTPRSILRHLQTSSNSHSKNDRLRHNSFATIRMPGHNARDGRTESHALASL